MIGALRDPHRWFGANGPAVRNALLPHTLGAGYAGTRRLLGADPSRWRWGSLQFTLFDHPIGSAGVDPATKAHFNVGPFERGGSEFTVNASSHLGSSFSQTSGPSSRMVLDVPVGRVSRRQYSRPVRRSGQPPLPRPRGLLADREVFPAALQPLGRGGERRTANIPAARIRRGLSGSTICKPPPLGKPPTSRTATPGKADQKPMPASPRKPVQAAPSPQRGSEAQRHPPKSTRSQPPVDSPARPTRARPVRATGRPGSPRPPRRVDPQAIRAGLHHGLADAG